LRAPLSGDISLGDVLNLAPFGNTLATFELKGADLAAALESGVSKYHSDSGSGRFPQVAGVRFNFDPTQPAGQWVSNVRVQTADGYASLDPNQVYRVVSIDYLRQGGDGYTIFQTNAINPYDFGPPLDESVEDYIKMLQGITDQNLISGRIIQ
jgi:5'-nucleotidase / UDP-sugar diphosphatase